MTGFCTECGHPLTAGEQCPVHGSRTDGAAPAVASKSGALTPARQIGPLPKANTTRRLLGSGIEYVAYLICIWIITILDAISAGLFGLLSLFLFGLIVLRDFNAGAFSLSKRVSQMRVVNLGSGKSASNVQALVRNGYYLVLLVLSAALPWVDWLSSTLFMLFVVLDVMMILASPKGRRLGDLLAGTQVVEAKS